MSDYYAPNQEVVGVSPAADGGQEAGQQQVEADADPLDAMTKAELIDEAETRGIDVSEYATKAEIREALG